MRITAHEIAADSDLYNLPVRFNRSRLLWECMGYSSSGETIRFARLEHSGDGIRQINRYVSPYSVVTVDAVPVKEVTVQP